MPYLSFAPSAWVLPLKFSGGGLSGGGKLMFDSQGNVWVVDNFMPGAQNQDYFWRGHLSKFAPDGTPLSPPVTGFTGGGLLGPGFGLAIDAHDNPWTSSFAGNWTISLFDNSGKPLSPPEGYNFDGKIGQLQGTIVTPGGDIWVADTTKSQLVHIPKGDPVQGRSSVHNPSSDPLANPCKLVLPFAFAIDQKDNIWVTNILADHVTRFPAADPTKVRDLQDRLLRQRPRRRQSRQRLDHQQARQFRARPPEDGGDGRCGDGQLRRRSRRSRQAHARADRRHGRTDARLGGRQPDGPASRRH